ncbi:MAG: hemolysin family protein [Gemmatimonadota bacterium]
MLTLGAGLVLLAAGALFVAAEHSLVAVRRPRLEELAEAGGRAARRAVAARRDLDHSLRGARLGSVLAGLAFGAVIVPPLAVALGRRAYGLGLPTGPAAALGALLGFAAAALAFLLLARALPRSSALARPERTVLATAGPLAAFCFAARPLLDLAANIELRRKGEEGRDRPGAEELEALLHGARTDGVERDEEAMIHGVFELNRTIAREVMTPRPDIVAFAEDAPLEEVLRVVAESGFSRFPVYLGSIDDVTGVVIAKDLLGWMRREDRGDFRLPGVMREPFFVPDSKPVDDLLAAFRRQKVHMAIVVDEFGGTDGVVTLEDLVEEIVGDIFDEHDVAEQEIERLPDGRILLDGGAALADVVDELDLENVEDLEEYDTVAGWVIGRLGRIPAAGEKVRMGQAELEVIETQEQRVTRLELRLEPAASGRVSEPILEGERDSR